MDSLLANDHVLAVRRLVDEVICGGNLALLDELANPQFINHSVIGTSEQRKQTGIDPFRHDIRQLRSAFPDLQITIDDLISVDDRVVIRVTASGTHLGYLGGAAPTGRSFQVSSITIIRFENGKFAERWNLSDRYGLFQQLGLL